MRSFLPAVVERDLPYVSMPSFVPVAESPETAIARTNSNAAARLLDRGSRRQHYVAALAIGAGVTNTYLNGLPPQDHAGLHKIRVEPERRRGGLFFGSRGMEITFERGRR